MNGLGYVREKASCYVRLGPEIYRKGDALGQPDASLVGENLARVGDGMRQLAEGRGTSSTAPLAGIGISALYNLMRVLHFEVTYQAAIEISSGRYLDVMKCRHVITNMTIEVFNEVVEEERDP